MRINFRQFILDTERRELTRGGEVVHLSPKALAVLEVLLFERPRAVPKRVLLERVWPDVAVEEQNVKNTIVEIRSAFGEAGGMIRTVQRFGYAFEGTVEEELKINPTQYWLTFDTRALPIAETNVDLGRDPSCAIFIDAPGVSRRHARIAIRTAAAMIEDLESKNGTWVEGKRITYPTPLRDGDHIRVGSVTLRFRACTGTQSTTTRGE